jgi:hypothetical protein
MGLFDSYYDPNSYGSADGGLIDRLISQLQTQGQYQPAAAGFAPAPEQAAPIAVGNYQMPRVGTEAAFTPDPAAIPQNAQPAQGQMPPQMMQTQQPPLPSILQQPGNGLLDHLNAGFQNFANGNGLISGLINGATGFATGQRLDPMSQHQEILRSQYQSLIPILGEAKARLAVLNPDIGKIMLSEALSSKEQFKTLKDESGREVPVFVNDRDQTINGKSVAEWQKSQPAAGGLGNMDLTGKEYLASLPKSEANIVQGMVEGTIAPPSSFARQAYLGEPNRCREKL